LAAEADLDAVLLRAVLLRADLLRLMGGNAPPFGSA
jgi:hypothetical protein